MTSAPSRRALPPLSTLRAFEAVVRLGSVGRAAEELGRTHGAVSKQLRALREDAGLPLFVKAGVGLRPTEAALRLADAVRDALDDLSARYDDIVRAARAPDIHVACSASFAMGWLVPNLPRFSALRPEIRIRLSMTSARAMREERDADLVILWDSAAWPPEARRRAIPLAGARFGVVAAPGYPAALDGGALRAPRQIRHDHTLQAWRTWSALTGLVVEAKETLSFPHTHLCVGAAVSGMGVAIAERRLVAAELAAGRLVAPGGFTPFPAGFLAIPHRARPMSASAKAFVAWLGEALAETDPPG